MLVKVSWPSGKKKKKSDIQTRNRKSEDQLKNVNGNSHYFSFWQMLHLMLLHFISRITDIISDE